MLSIAAGNLFTSAVNFFIRDDNGTGRLTGAGYYLFFTALMLVTAPYCSACWRVSTTVTLSCRRAEAMPGRDSGWARYKIIF